MRFLWSFPFINDRPKMGDPQIIFLQGDKGFVNTQWFGWFFNLPLFFQRLDWVNMTFINSSVFFYSFRFLKCFHHALPGFSIFFIIIIILWRWRRPLPFQMMGGWLFLRMFYFPTSSRCWGQVIFFYSFYWCSWLDVWLLICRVTRWIIHNFITIIIPDIVSLNGSSISFLSFVHISALWSFSQSRGIWAITRFFTSWFLCIYLFIFLVSIINTLTTPRQDFRITWPSFPDFSFAEVCYHRSWLCWLFTFFCHFPLSLLFPPFLPLFFPT